MTDLKGDHGATIGAQLRRLSERIDHDVGRVYAHLGIISRNCGPPTKEDAL